MARWRVLLSVPVLTAGLLFVADGCTTADDAGAPPSGSSPPAADGAGTSDDAGVAADAADDTGCPAYSGSDSYCAAVHERCRACSASMRPCDIANLATCEATSAIYSRAGREAASKCYAPGCAGGGDDECVKQVLTSAPLSTAQQHLVDGFCAACALSASAQSCASRFFFRPRDGGIGPGPGARIKTVNDTLVTKVDQACIPLLGDAGDACENLFFYCANQALAGTFPKRACLDGGI